MNREKSEKINKKIRKLKREIYGNMTSKFEIYDNKLEKLEKQIEANATINNELLQYYERNYQEISELKEQIGKLEQWNEKVRYECDHCERELKFSDLQWSEGDEAYECPYCGCCFFAIRELAEGEKLGLGKTKKPITSNKEQGTSSQYNPKPNSKPSENTIQIKCDVCGGFFRDENLFIRCEYCNKLLHKDQNNRLISKFLEKLIGIKASSIPFIQLDREIEEYEGLQNK